MSHADQEPPREPTVSGTARARPRASAPALGAAGAQNRARVDFGALKQWAGTGKVKRRPTASHHRRYRLGQWQSQSASSWNPPNTPHSSSPGASGGNRSLASVDISHKPSESRRSSIISLQSAGAGGGYASENEGDSEDECKGPLAQMLLKENDEIWNNSAFRFTFYSPVTGTVRSTDVQTLRTDHADGLDALIRLATGDYSADNSSSGGGGGSSSGGDAASSRGSDSAVPAVPTIAQPPQLSVTSADSVPDVAKADATAGSPDNEYLHPNYARRQPPRTSKGHNTKHRSSAAPSATSPDNARHAVPADDTDGQAKSQQPQMFWLDIMNPTDSEIMALSRIFDLHPLTTEELLLMRDEGLSQDSYKSFRHYDVICYRTSAASTPATIAATATEAATAGGNNAGVSSVTKRRSLVRDIAKRVHSSWGADEDPDRGNNDDLFVNSPRSMSDKPQLGERFRQPI
ncbi:CorA metal ion transporter, partial [Coemansia sp. RSA 2681]